MGDSLTCITLGSQNLAFVSWQISGYNAGKERPVILELEAAEDFLDSERVTAALHDLLAILSRIKNPNVSL